MKEYFDCLMTTHGLAFATGTAIFLLTVLLVAKRLIGFTFSVVMLLIALGATWAINNDAWVRKQIDRWTETAQTTTTTTRSTSATEIVPVQTEAVQINTPAPAAPLVEPSVSAIPEATQIDTLVPVDTLVPALAAPLTEPSVPAIPEAEEATAVPTSVQEI